MMKQKTKTYADGSYHCMETWIDKVAKPDLPIAVYNQ